MSDLLTDIADFLIASGLAVGKSIDVFKNSSPPEPDAVITVYEYGGRPPPYPVEILERNIQIACRDSDPDQAKNKAWQIYNLIYPENTTHKKINLAPGRWAIIIAHEIPYELRVDENNRSIWICNYTFTTQRD